MTYNKKTKINIKIKNEDEIKESANPIQKNALKFAALGGLEEIGRNMSFFEFKNEIIVIDMGLQFPEETTPGVDFIIPNVEYLVKKRENIKAIIITHAHYDHVGAIPYLIGKIGNPLIYTTKLTKAIIEKRQSEFENAPKLRVIEVKYGDKVKMGEYFEVEFFGTDHTIPENTGLKIITPIGNIVHFSDFRIEYNEQNEPQNLEIFKKIAKDGIHTFMVDSTNAEKEGRSMSEKVIEKNLETLFKEAKGRIILSTFSSMITRIAEIIKIAEKLNKKVAINGKSMRDNLLIAKNLGYIKASKNTFISVEEINNYKDEEILILTTGAQGESSAGLMKIVTGAHKYIKIKPGDTIIFSSSVIPGNEKNVQRLKDNLARQGAIVYTPGIIDIHVSGHALKDDLISIMKILKPRFVMPVHGYYFMRFINAQNAIAAGIKPENIRLLDNGQVAYLTEDDFIISNETVPANYVLVDGLGIGDVGEVVLRDRLMLAQEGMFEVIVTIDKKTGRLLKNPDIISKGFIYIKDNQELLEEIRKKVKGIIARATHYRSVDTDYLKTIIRDQVGQFLFNKTQRRPMILSVIIEV
jgi:ribonuclease J